MKRFTVFLVVMATVGSAIGQTLSDAQIRQPYKFRKIWNAAAGTSGAENGITVDAVNNSAFVQSTVVTMAATPVVIVEGGTGTNGYGGVKIYDFPAGRIFVLGVTVDSFTITIDTNTLDVADGAAFAFGTTVDATGTQSGTVVDLCPATSVDPITNVVNSALAASAQFDGTTTAKDMYMSLMVDDGDISATSTNAVSAVITINWLNLGDY